MTAEPIGPRRTRALAGALIGLALLGAAGLAQAFCLISVPASVRAPSAPTKVTTDTISTSGLIVASNTGFGTDVPRSGIFTMKPDRTGRQILTEDNRDSLPAWSYDGKQIAYASRTRGGPPQIWAMNADGRNKRQITFVAAGALMPSWSRDGALAFVTASHQNPRNIQIWMMQSLSSTPHPVTSDDTFNYAAMLSPDGTKVAFTRVLNNDEHREIFVANVDGTNVRQLTFPSDPNSPDANVPTWSPDGTKIAFFSGFEAGNAVPGTNSQQVSVMNADGSNRRVLTHCTVPCMAADNPAWSPDGTMIIYERGASGQGTHTWIMNADGSNARELLPFGYGAGRRPWTQ